MRHLSVSAAAAAAAERGVGNAINAVMYDDTRANTQVLISICILHEYALCVLQADLEGAIADIFLLRDEGIQLRVGMGPLAESPLIRTASAPGNHCLFTAADRRNHAHGFTARNGARRTYAAAEMGTSSHASAILEAGCK